MSLSDCIALRFVFCTIARMPSNAALGQTVMMDIMTAQPLPQQGKCNNV
jgi:hypothetical protein